MPAGRHGWLDDTPAARSSVGSSRSVAWRPPALDCCAAMRSYAGALLALPVTEALRAYTSSAGCYMGEECNPPALATMVSQGWGKTIAYALRLEVSQWTEGAVMTAPLRRPTGAQVRRSRGRMQHPAFRRVLDRREARSRQQ